MFDGKSQPTKAGLTKQNVEPPGFLGETRLKIFQRIVEYVCVHYIIYKSICQDLIAAIIKPDSKEATGNAVED